MASIPKPSTLQLPDGRTLEYATQGGKSGIPLVFIHGSPGAYPPMPAFSRACEAKDIPLVTFSRSGYGSSSRHKGRIIVDVVKDTQALLDHLGYKQCMIAGWSGGGPHALACAARLPGCQSAGVIATLAPYEADGHGLDWFEGQGEDNVEEGKAALRGEDDLRKFLQPQHDQMRIMTALEITEMMSSLFPEVDKNTIINDPEVGTTMETMFRTALEHGDDGSVDDSLSFMQPWGFDLSEIKCPTALYHGSADKMCAWGHGLWIADHIPAQYLTKHLEEGEGHMSIILGRELQFVEELIRLAKQGPGGQ